MSALNSDFFTDGDKDVMAMMSQSWSENAQANQTFWQEGTLDTRFKSGDQHLWNELFSKIPTHQRKKFNFNRIRRIINMVAGHQRRTRKSTVVLPIEGADEETADQFSTLLQWVNNQSDVYHTISEAFEGAITTGLNMLSIWMDYRNDPINGDIRIDNLKYNNVLLDQHFIKPDMSDAQFMWTRKFVTRGQAASLIPERKSDIMQMGGGYKDNKFNWLPPNFRNEGNSLVAYDEYWHQAVRDQELLIDTVSGETMEWRGSKDALSQFLKDFPQIQMHKIPVNTVMLAILVNDVVMYHGPNPMGIDRYPFVPVLGYFESEAPYYEWKIQGLVRGLRDAQFLYNRRKIIELDILESQINSGFKIMEDSLIDDNDAFLTGQGRALFLKKNAPLGMASVEQIPPPQIPPSMIQLSELLAQEMNQISGVNEELLGSAQDDKAGILSMLRQGAGLTTLETVFDNLDRSQKLLGELAMMLIQANWGPGKVGRILGEKPSEQFFNKSFQKFDSVVTEGTLTETQRKASFITLMEMQKLGINIPPEILIDKAPIPEKKDLKKAMEQQAQQAAQAQQQAQQLQMAQAKAQIELAQARADADRGLRHERDSRVLSNIGLAEERRAESVSDLERATLDKLKAAKELIGIDLNSLSQLLEIVSKIKQQEEATLGEQASNGGEKLNAI